MASVKKSDINIDKDCVQLKFLMKGFRQEIIVTCLITECMDFVDYLNKNETKFDRRKIKEGVLNEKFWLFDRSFA